MKPSKLLIAGAGGLGREVLAVLTASGKVVGGFLVEAGYPESEVAGLPVFSDPGIWASADLIALAIGDVRVRRRLYSLFSNKYLTVIHPVANIGPRVSIGDGSLILGLVNITCDAQVGAHVLINPGCTISHDCSIGSFSNLGPNVALAGNVVIGENVNLGTGAIVLPGCRVGDNATVGAGAVVVTDVAPGLTVYGVPAKPPLKS